MLVSEFKEAGKQQFVTFSKSLFLYKIMTKSLTTIEMLTNLPVNNGLSKSIRLLLDLPEISTEMRLVLGRILSFKCKI